MWPELCCFVLIQLIDLFEESEEGLHLVPKSVTDKPTVREFFVFGDGVAVFWGIEDSEVCFPVFFI